MVDVVVVGDKKCTNPESIPNQSLVYAMTAAQPLHQQHSQPQQDRAAYKRARKLHLKSTKNRPPDDSFDWTPFRAAEKKYKAKFPPPDLSNVLDFALNDASRYQEVEAGRWKGKAPGDEVIEIRLNSQGYEGNTKAYCLKSAPGMILDVNHRRNYVHKRTYCRTRDTSRVPYPFRTTRSCTVVTERTQQMAKRDKS